MLKQAEREELQVQQATLLSVAAPPQDINGSFTGTLSDIENMLKVKGICDV